MIDAHIHLEQYDQAVLEDMLSGLPGQGIDGLIAVSMNLESSVRTLELARRAPGLIKPAYGYHPEQPVPEEAELAALLRFIEEHAAHMAAVGEIGLPYYSRAEALERGLPFEMEPYIRLLDTLLGAAAQLGKPVVLHAVYEDALTACDLLDKHGIRDAHFHWFKGPEEAVARMIERGYYISFTPDIVYEPEIQALARRYPPELVMAETDGPWPFEGPFAGRLTHPAMIRDAAAAWGALHGYSPAQAEALLSANTARFFRLYESTGSLE
ncbi:DNAase [Paenibacillus sp. FSL R7-0273]|uniref:TatD family hydrolase n=1 Tax=Paenibacillus sp. FSL R7-0273 TaxID=1536772 RepID=UPI0004F6A3B0|nr:TatD family hydrolase [Paenibacillus sp. FSL R7-0273]AIQ45396.1 DNAase [Paenibacillus sp. FSL R7-0273]OMF89976.1 DNAase [Paenibacillus sp. FSL R7-0273]